MKVEHVSSNVFSIELSSDEIKYALTLAGESKDRLNKIITLWCEIGYAVSKLVSEGMYEPCEQNKSIKPNIW